MKAQGRGRGWWDGCRLEDGLWAGWMVGGLVALVLALAWEAGAWGQERSAAAGIEEGGQAAAAGLEEETRVVRAGLGEGSKASTLGLAVSAGYGYQSGLLGADVLLYMPCGGPVTMAAYAGLGWVPTVGVEEGDAPAADLLSWAVGFMALGGGQHRAVLDVSFGLSSVVQRGGPADGYEGGAAEPRHWEALPGMTVAMGYELMTEWGLFFRPTLGVTTVFGEVHDDDHVDRVHFTGNVAVGYKFF